MTLDIAETVTADPGEGRTWKVMSTRQDRLSWDPKVNQQWLPQTMSE